MIVPDLERMDLSILLKCSEKPSPRMIKITSYSIEGCSYCDNQISLKYDLHCLEKSITYRIYKLSQESEKCRGNEWDSSYEMLVYRQKQHNYSKHEMVKLKAIFNLD